MDIPLAPWSYALVAAVVAPVVAMRKREPLSWKTAAAAAAGCQLAPVAGLWLPAQLDRLVFGKEGVVEAITAGMLLGLVAVAIRFRAPWVGAAAALLLLEEIDYGQLLLGFDTPAWAQALPSRSDRFNFHNVPILDGVWRLAPLVALAAVSRRPWGRAESLARRWRLPNAEPRLWIGLCAVGLGGVLCWISVGERRFDEAFELALVVIATAALRFAARDATPAGKEETR